MRRPRTCDQCGQPALPYLYGDRCDTHARPVPIPDPTLTLTALRDAHGLRAVGTLDVTSALNDKRAIASGKWRASAGDYRLARAAEDERRRS